MLARVISGAFAAALTPLTGTAKLRISEISDALMPTSASGGNCTSRCADACAAARLVS